MVARAAGRDLDDVGRASEAVFESSRRVARLEAAPGRGLRCVRTVIEARTALCRYRLWPELDLRASREVEHRLPRVLESVIPPAWNAVLGVAPAELIHEHPPPLPHVREHQILYIEAPLPVLAVFLDVQEERSVRREVLCHECLQWLPPVGVLVRRDRLEPAAFVVPPLACVWRRGYGHRNSLSLSLSLAEGVPRHWIAAVAADDFVRRFRLGCELVAAVLAFTLHEVLQIQPRVRSPGPTP